ncbi:hypothetical protein ACP70R_007820 [Stipagrostis hirtigluma subsp. patula]
MFSQFNQLHFPRTEENLHTQTAAFMKSLHDKDAAILQLYRAKGTPRRRRSGSGRRRRSGSGMSTMMTCLVL